MFDGVIPTLSHAPALRDQVYSTLESLIIGGELRPGDRLAEAELAVRLGVSRNPVREALNLLAHSGWVDIRGRRHGAVVHTPTEKEMEDLLWVRTRIKCDAARLAARHVDPASSEALADFVRGGLAAVAAGDMRAAADLNSAFHERVDLMTDNSVLQEVLRLLKKRLRWYFAPVARVRGEESWRELEQLMTALAAHDADAAAEAMRHHCERTAEVCRKSIASVAGGRAGRR